ncbi:hypothetical protein FJTKL_03910 [Diaporthe vaccinii]|uniref:Uncharacterized protein n=1 Tax=Diaporthe vaccinii TaxID=105482 RepID=A0ABR4F1H4_9PEZI
MTVHAETKKQRDCGQRTDPSSRELVLKEKTPPTTLQQLGQQTDEAQTNDGRVDVDVASGAARVAAAARGAVASGATSVGLVVVGRAGELALNDTVATLGAGSQLLQLSAGRVDVVGGGHLEGSLDYLLAKVAANLDGTAKLSQLGESGKLLQGGVVDDSQGTTEALEARESDVGELRVVDEGDVTTAGGGHVGGSEALEVVGVKPGRTVDDLERGGRELGNVGNGHVGDPDQVGHGDAQLGTVGLDVQVLAQVLERRVELGQAAVVVDVHAADRLQVDTIQALQEGVGDGDGVSLADTGAEAQRVQSGQRLPRDGADAGQGRHVEGGQQGHVGESECSRDRGEGRGRERDDGAIVLQGQVTIDLLGAGQVDLGVGGRGDQDITLERAAVGESSGLSGRADCEGGLCAGGGLRWRYLLMTLSTCCGGEVEPTRGNSGRREGRDSQLGEHFAGTVRTVD